MVDGMSAVVEKPPSQQSVAIAQDSREWMALIERMATNKDVSVEKLNGLLDLQERLMRKNAEVEANQAFARVCANMPRIKKNGLIDFGKGQKPISYAKWEDVQDVIKPIYEAERFRLGFDTEPREGGGLIVIAILTHENGHIITSRFPVPLDTSGGKQNIQGMGSAGSYGQRYATKNLFNLVFEGEDDDGIRGAATFIDLEQCKVINALLDTTKADIMRFLQFMEVAEVANIQKKDYTRALNALGTKIVREQEGTK
jgi:ERF superfamily